jgi:hypothetical protein
MGTLIIGGHPRLLADLANAPSLNPDPGHVQGLDLNPRTTDPSPDPNLSPRQSHSRSEYVVNTGQLCMQRLSVSSSETN